MFLNHQLEPLRGFNEDIVLGEDQDQTSKSSYGCKLVPWLNWSEWESVRDCLFSTSPSKIASAVTRISTWRSRGCLPVVIDVTASIIEIQQKDPFYRKDLPSDALHSDQLLSMLYCMSILRLVNCVVEKTRKKTEISIAEAAGAIGIPRTLIDIRHEGSHRDLPALNLVRDSAVKAIDWLKSYYWKPQTQHIPFQRDETAKVRKQVKLKLQEFASCLNARESGGSPSKGRSRKHKHLLCGRTKFFSVMARKLYVSKSGGLKKQTAKTLKTLVRLYSTFSSQLLSVLLELLLKALDASNLLEFPDEVGPDIRTSLDDWKLVVVKLSNKEPELLLTLLKAILNIIESQEALKYGIGMRPASIGSSATAVRIEQFSSVFAWLVGKLLKLFHPKDGKAKTVVSAAELNMSNTTLVEVLRKCLLISSYGNKELVDSAGQLAKLVGCIPSMDKLSKLSLLCSAESYVTGDNYSLTTSSKLLAEQDESIREAANKLELIKRRLAMRRTATISDVDSGGSGRWVVAKSWNPCPIGMLPRDLGSSGCLPVFDHQDGDNKLASSSGTKWQLRLCSGAEEHGSDIHADSISGVARNKRESSSDICLPDISSAKKLRESVESGESDSRDVSLPTDIKGCLLINGTWKNTGEEEQLAIKFAVST